MADSSQRHFPQIYNRVPGKIQKRCQLTFPPKTKSEGVETVEENFCENLCSLGVGKIMLSLTPKADITKIHGFDDEIIDNFNIFFKKLKGK